MEWSNEELTNWTKNNTSYKYKIYRIDVDLALGYIYTCNLNKSNKQRIKAINRIMSIEGITKEESEKRLENTCSIKGLMKFISFKKQEHQHRKINKCDKKKAIALIKLLEHLGLIECMDENYSTGISRKYKVCNNLRQSA